MARKESGLRWQLKKRLGNALGHLVEVCARDIGSPNGLEEQRVTREECIPLLAVEADTALTVSRRVNRNEVCVEDGVSVLEEERRLWKFTIQLLEDGHRLIAKRLKELRVGAFTLRREVRSVTPVYPNLDLFNSVSVVVDNR